MTNKAGIINPEKLKSFSESFSESGLKIDLFDEFFKILYMIACTQNGSPMPRISALFENHELLSAVEAKKFIDAYISFHNTIVKLLDNFPEVFESNQKTDYFNNLFSAFKEISPSSNFAAVMKEASFSLITYILDIAGLDIRKKGFKIEHIGKAVNEDFEEAFIQLSQISVSINQNKDNNEVLVDAFTGLLSAVFFFNEDRKLNFNPDDFIDSEPYRKNESTGRNDPCPCGSGKKYKKCCLIKDENPFYDLLPVNPPLPRLTRTEIAEFYSLLNVFFKHADAVKNNKESDVIGDYFVIANNGKEVLKPIFSKDPAKIVDLFNFIKTDRSKIINSCLKKFEKDSFEYNTVKSWKSAICDDFVVLEHAPQGCSIFWMMDEQKTKNMYLVYSLYDDISNLIVPIPAIGQTMILPFKDRVVFCGLFMRHPVSLSTNIVNMMTDDYISKRKKDRVKTTLTKK